MCDKLDLIRVKVSNDVNTMEREGKGFEGDTREQLYVWTVTSKWDKEGK